MLQSPQPRLILLILLTGCTVASAQQEWPEYEELDESWKEVDSIRYHLAWRIESDSTDLDAHLQLVALLKTSGAPEEQLRAAEAMVAANLDSSQAWYYLGDALLDNGLPKDAVPVLKQAVGLDPYYVKALTMLAEAYTSLRRNDSALRALDRAIEINPRTAQPYAQRAQLLIAMGRRTDAAEDYRSWGRLSPLNPEPWKRLGRTLLETGEITEGIASLEYAASLDPESTDLQYEIAVILAEVGPTESAISALRDFFYSFPNDPRSLDAERRIIELGGSVMRR